MTETDRAAVVSLCIAAHQNEGFAALFSFLSPECLHVLGYAENDRLVSHALISTRWLQPEGLPLLKTAYVDAVATLPLHQGHGFGSAVMRRLAAIATEDQYEIGGLETSDQAGFYQRLGWELWRGALAGRSAEGLIPTPDQTGVMILSLPLSPPLNLDSLLTIESHPARIW